MVNEEYFSVIDTVEKAYWLGFLYADGFVKKTGSTVRLCLSVKDDLHLDKFILAVGGSLEDKKYYGPYKTSGRQVHFSIFSYKLVSDLIKLGCVYKKSKIIRLPEFSNLSLDLSFLKGYYDGDGTQLQSSITCGSYEFLLDIYQKYALKTHIIKKNDCYSLSLGSSLFHLMNISCFCGLERKSRLRYERFPSLFDEEKHVIHIKTKIEQPKKFEVSKEELEKLVWEFPMTELAKRFNVSNNAVKKRCQKFGIEFPTRGYWAKKYAGKLESLPA